MSNFLGRSPYLDPVFLSTAEEPGGGLMNPDDMEEVDLGVLITTLGHDAVQRLYYGQVEPAVRAVPQPEPPEAVPAALGIDQAADTPSSLVCRVTIREVEFGYMTFEQRNVAWIHELVCGDLVYDMAISAVSFVTAAPTVLPEHLQYGGKYLIQLARFRGVRSTSGHDIYAAVVNETGQRPAHGVMAQRQLLDRRSRIRPPEPPPSRESPIITHRAL